MKGVAGHGYDFGQREHLAVLFILPFLAEAAMRSVAVGPKRTLHFAVAACAAIGAALKPHFFLLPLLVEGLARLKHLRNG